MFASSLKRTDERARRPEAGQSAIELAIGIPLVLLPTLFRMLNIGLLVTDKVMAAYAVRQGARVAAQLGNGQTTNPALTTLQLDQNACQAVVASASSLVFANLEEIDIYNASNSATANGDGSMVSPPAPSALYDSYDPACNPTRAGTFPAVGSGGILDPTGRVQVPPDETSIGVRLTWKYTAPTGTQRFSVTVSDYTVMRAAVVPG